GAEGFQLHEALEAGEGIEADVAAGFHGTRSFARSLCKGSASGGPIRLHSFFLVAAHGTGRVDLSRGGGGGLFTYPEAGGTMSEREVRKTAGAVNWREVSAGKGARSQVLLGPEDGMPHFAMRRFQMDTGGGMPLHTNTVEHEQYVLRGK